MDDVKRQEFEKAFFQLKQAYIRRLANTVRIIDNILELEKTRMPKREDVMRAQALVHGLAGSGTTFGFPQITEIGHQADYFFEMLLREMREGAVIDADNYKTMQSWLRKTQNICYLTCHESHLENPALANGNIYITPGTREHAHILVVDDDPEVAGAIAQALQARGMTIQISSNAEDGLHYLARVQPDLVLLDLALPGGIDGLETLQQIKQNSEFVDIPVVMLVTRYTEDDEKFARQAGALDYIRKPVDVTKLSDQVLEIVKKQYDKAQSM